MKGSVVKCFHDMICSKFGKEMWNSSIEGTGFEKIGVILPSHDFDDTEVMVLIYNICENLNWTLEQTADAYGDYWINVYSQELYSNYYERYNNAAEFLTSLDKLHLTITSNISNARPPRFIYRWINDKMLEMTYLSDRGLLDIVVGLAKGIGKYYNEKLILTKIGEDRIRIQFTKSRRPDDSKVDSTTE